MSKLHQPKTNWPQSAISRPTERERSSGRGGSVRKTLTIGLLLVGTLLASCSDDQPRSQNSEMRVDGPAAAGEAGATAPETANVLAAEPEAEPLPGAGRRYRVVVETAYFFDQPRQSTPNGRYLRRGDTFYGEGETNGFVKTGFVQPNGAPGTGWLKVQGLSKLAGSTASQPSRSSRRAVPATRPAATSPPVEDGYEADETSATAAAPARTGATGLKTAVVQVARSYFYNSPDLAQPRKAYCERGDKVRLGETRGAAVYVTFTNWEKVTTTGWMRKDALR